MVFTLIIFYELDDVWMGHLAVIIDFLKSNLFFLFTKSVFSIYLLRVKIHINNNKTILTATFFLVTLHIARCTVAKEPTPSI